MSLGARLQYYRRIFSAYLSSGASQLTFWHDHPQVNDNARFDRLAEYYMLFPEKADYNGPVDSAGIPMLDYRGQIGVQYNPIAIAQWGLGNYDFFCRTNDETRRLKFIAASDWLCAHLEKNSFEIAIWNHHFDWEYRSTLRAPWYSALAQGQGISLLIRAHAKTGASRYLDAAHQAFESFVHSVDKGGVTYTDRQNQLWLEEYIVSPPTHILNGFIWAAWGVYDYFLATNSPVARDLFAQSVQTLKTNLAHYDLGFWSLYEQSGTRLPMIASAFYHRLHIVQLRIMNQLTGDEVFAQYANRWEAYTKRRVNRARALCYKSAFKLLYY